MILFIGCTSDPKGSEFGDERDHNPTGDCKCLSGLIGSKCNKCDIGYYGAVNGYPFKMFKGKK